jgi:hypothetical protein
MMTSEELVRVLSVMSRCFARYFAAFKSSKTELHGVNGYSPGAWERVTAQSRDELGWKSRFCLQGKGWSGAQNAQLDVRREE